MLSKSKGKISLNVPTLLDMPLYIIIILELRFLLLYLVFLIIFTSRKTLSHILMIYGKGSALAWLL